MRKSENRKFSMGHMTWSDLIQHIGCYCGNKNKGICYPEGGNFNCPAAKCSGQFYWLVDNLEITTFHKLKYVKQYATNNLALFFSSV